MNFTNTVCIHSVLANGTLLQKTKLQNSTVASCSVFIAFSNIGQIIFDIPTTAAATSQIIGPSILLNQWTYLGSTYNQIDSLIIYIDGVRQGTIGNISYTTWGTNYNWLNVG